MKMSRFQQVVLGLAGFTPLAIGAFILLAPHAFYEGYGISLGNDVNLLSELRSPGANLAAMGVVIMAGLFKTSLTRVSIAFAITLFLAFPVGRIIGILADGMPSESVITALFIEVFLAILLLFAFGIGEQRKYLVNAKSY